MNADERRQVETELVKMGLAGLKENGDPSPELIQQIAGIVNAWRPTPNRHGEWIDRHKFLRDLLGECDAKDRAEMYSAIVPYLNFTAEPLSHYESQIRDRVNRLATRGMKVVGDSPRPIELGGQKFVEADAKTATHAMLLLKCQRCKQTKSFLGPTPVSAMIEARKAGWKRIQKETCPKCVKVMSKKLAVN